jgi:glycosyltransferase involved in cell wall biosynthesis
MYIWQLDPANLTPYYDLAVCDALAQAGHEVRFISTRYIHDPKLVIPTGFITDYRYFKGVNWDFLLNRPYLRRGIRAISYPLGHLGVLRLVHQHRPDVIHIQWSRLPKLDMRLWRRFIAQKIPLVHTVHDIAPMFASPAMQADLLAVYQHMDALILHTQANITAFMDVYPSIPHEKLHLIPMIAFPNPPLPPSANQQSAREALGLPIDAPIALFFGAIKHYKGLDVLLEAFMQAHAKNPDIHLVVAGKYDTTQRDKLPALDAIANMPNVHLYEGFIPTHDIWKYHLAADVIVHPYRDITQSAALITAMGYGRAVIVTDVGGMGETLDGNGWVIVPENPSALADGLLEALSDRTRLRDMGEKSALLIDNRHSPHEVARRLVDVYQSVIDIPLM